MCNRAISARHCFMFLIFASLAFVLVLEYPAAAAQTTPTVPGQPSNFTIESDIEFDRLRMAWYPPSDNGGAGITGYVMNIKWQQNGNSYEADYPLPYRCGGKFIFDFFGNTYQAGSPACDWSRHGPTHDRPTLKSDTVYTITLSAKNRVGTGEPITIDFRHGLVPTAPRNLSIIESLSSDGLVLQWYAPASDGGSPIIGYEVRASWIHVNQQRVFVQYITVENLDDNTNYNYVVFNGCSMESRIANPPNPSNPGSRFDFVSFPSNTPCIADGIKYNFEIVPVNKIGNGHSITDSYTKSLATPHSVKATPYENEIIVSWSDTALGNPDINYIVVIRLGTVNPFMETDSLPSTRSSLTFRGLQDGLTYQFAVYSTRGDETTPLSDVVESVFNPPCVYDSSGCPGS